MNALQRIAHVFTKNGIEAKAAAVSPVMGYGVAQFFDLLPASPSFEGSRLTARLAYKRDNLVFACMQFRAIKLSEAPLWIAEEKDDGEEWLQAHALESLLEQPNPDQDMAEFISVVSHLVDTDGEVLIVKVRDNGKRVVQLWPYNKDLYTVEPANGRLHGLFRINTQQGQETVSPEDVIYLQEPDPSNLRESVSRVKTALAKINLSQDLVSTIRQILRKGVQPGMILSFKNPLNDIQRVATREAIATQYAGVHNAGKAMVLDGEVTSQIIAASLKEMTTGPAQYDCEAAICQAFQVHPILVGAKVGIESNSGLSDSIEPALRLFYDVAALPRWRWLERKLTKGLLREIDPNVRRFIRFDTSKVKSLQEGMLSRVQTAAAAREFWTVDEARVYTDREPLGDERGEMLIAEMARPVVDPALEEEEDDEGERDEKARKRTRSSTDAASRHLLFFSRRAVQEAHEFTLEMAARRALNDDLTEVLSIVRGSTKADPVGPLPDPDAVIAKVGAYLKGTAQERWDERMRGPMEALGRHSVQQMAAELRVSFELLEPGLLDFIDREVGFLIKSVTDTTRDAVRKEIHAGIAAGESIDQIAARITDAAGFDIERSRLIARTESTRATNGAQRESLADYEKTSGSKAKKEWLATLDDRTRDEHERMDGERRGINEPFSNGLQAPGEPNCRCTLLYSIEEATA